MRHHTWDKACETSAQCEQVIEELANVVAATRAHLDRSRAVVDKINEVLKGVK